MEGVVKVYKTFKSVEKALTENRPIAAVRSKGSNQVWVIYRPNSGRANKTRSSIDAMEILFDDQNGCNVHSLCWFAPIQLKEQSVKMMDSVMDLPGFVDEHVLMLPQMIVRERTECVFSNNYYCIGHKWTERNKLGEFTSSKIDPSIFGSWLNDDQDTTSAVEEEDAEAEEDEEDDITALV